MAVTPTYPNGILPWVNRIDQQNTVYAADPNTLAADLIAVESTLGTNPQVELAPPVGVQVTYPNVSARIHDVQLGNQLPVVSLGNPAYNVKHSNTNPIRVSYNKLLDDFGFHNGTDITLQASGWYIVTVQQSHDWAASGYFDTTLLVNSGAVVNDRWSWDFPENQPRVPGFAPKGTLQSFTWQGPLSKGDRLSVENINVTSKSVMPVQNAYLRACYIRSIPSGTAG
jgi:hypothetical protein